MDPQTRAVMVEMAVFMLVDQMRAVQLTYIREASSEARQYLHEACISLADTISELERREGR